MSFAKKFKRKGMQVAPKKVAQNDGQQSSDATTDDAPKRKTLGQRIAERNS